MIPRMTLFRGFGIATSPNNRRNLLVQSQACREIDTDFV
jgi:hypothetical protein